MRFGESDADYYAAMEVEKMNVGESIRKRREALKLSQVEVATAAGISSAMLCQIERGTKNPSLQVSMALAEKLRCSVEDFCREPA